jgi:hypothetical protein
MIGFILTEEQLIPGTSPEDLDPRRGLPIVRHEMREFNGTEPLLVNSVDGRFVRLRLRITADET